VPGPKVPLETLHRTYLAALAPLGLEPDRRLPAGYEHNFATGNALVCVCPWHWRQYSHYQFWELYAAARLARLERYGRRLLLTNAEWTGWCWRGFESVFELVVVAEADETRAALERALERDVPLLEDPPAPSPGAALIGSTRPGASTVELKTKLRTRLGGGRPEVRPVFGGGRAVPFDLEHEGVLIGAKGFRNPDTVHEWKIMAGKALAAGPDRRALFVIDGRPKGMDVMPPGYDLPWTILTRAGGSACTLDRLEQALARLS
jgi:hypothetical protein